MLCDNFICRKFFIWSILYIYAICIMYFYKLFIGHTSKRESMYSKGISQSLDSWGKHTFLWCILNNLVLIVGSIFVKNNHIVLYNKILFFLYVNVSNLLDVSFQMNWRYVRLSGTTTIYNLMHSCVWCFPSRCSYRQFDFLKWKSNLYWMIG